MPTQTSELIAGWQTIPVFSGSGGKRLASLSIQSDAGVTLEVVAVGRAAPHSDATLQQSQMAWLESVVVGAGTTSPGYVFYPPYGDGYEDLSPNVSPISLGIKATAPTTVTVTTQFERVVVQEVGGFAPVSDAGMTLVDPSGVVESWSIVNGVVTVTTNAVAGVAWVLKDKTPTASLLLGAVRSKQVVPSTAGRLGLYWGVAGDVNASALQYVGVGTVCEGAGNGRSGVAVQNVENITASVDVNYNVGTYSLGAPVSTLGSAMATAVASGQHAGTLTQEGRHARQDTKFVVQKEGLRIYNELASVNTGAAYIEVTSGDVSYT